MVVVVTGEGGGEGGLWRKNPLSSSVYGPDKVWQYVDVDYLVKLKSLS